MKYKVLVIPRNITWKHKRTFPLYRQQQQNVNYVNNLFSALNTWLSLLFRLIIKINHKRPLKSRVTFDQRLPRWTLKHRHVKVEQIILHCSREQGESWQLNRPCQDHSSVSATSNMCIYRCMSQCKVPKKQLSSTNLKCFSLPHFHLSFGQRWNCTCWWEYCSRLQSSMWKVSYNYL